MLFLFVIPPFVSNSVPKTKIKTKKELIKIKDKIKKEIDHPSYYNVGKHEVIDIIEDWKLNFNLGNAIKYIARAEHKNNKVDDLNKAIWYIKRELNPKKDIFHSNVLNKEIKMPEMYPIGPKEIMKEGFKRWNP